MTIAPYIRQIGRGKEGARALSQTDAHALMHEVLAGRVSDFEVGAFAVAMRIKGESVAELAGFLAAVRERCRVLPADGPTVVLPSYNGARKLPNLTALLALLLAQEGVNVLVHGPERDAARITTSTIFRTLGLPFATDAAGVEAAWSRHEPVFMTTRSLCPPLARLLAVRDIVGLRNPGHTVAKLLMPCDGEQAMQVVNYTHPEYAVLQHEFLLHSGANALSMRGTEGEPVADPRRAPRLDVYLGGALRPELGALPQEGVLTAVPVLPVNQAAAATAVYIQAVVSGEKPAPAPLLQQVQCLLRALSALDTARQAAATLASSP